MSDQKMEKWLRQQIFRAREVPLERFSLRSAASGTKAEEVETFALPADFNGDNVGVLLDEITSRAQADADGMGTKLQRYVLVAIEMGAKSGPRYPFKVRGEGEEEDRDESDDDGQPTEKGLTRQLMRHNEALMRMLVMTTGSAVTSMSRRLDNAEATNLAMVKQRSEDLRVLEAAKTEQHERDQQLLLVSGQEERKNELFKKLELLMPIVVNKLSGRDVMPVGKGADIFQTLADSLQPEQLQQIAPFLTQEQQMLLLTLLKSAREKSAASEKQKGEAS